MRSWFCLWLVACSADPVGDAPPSSAPIAPAALSQPDDLPPGDGAVADEDPAAPADEPADTGAPQDPPVDDRLYPLDAGWTWTFDIRSTMAACPSGRRTEEIRGQRVDGGRDVFAVHTACGTDAQYAMDGDAVDTRFDMTEYGYGLTEWTRLLDAPVEDGHTWETTSNGGALRYRYEAVPQITTPAGEFQGCWKTVQLNFYTSEAVYCPGVGRVWSRAVAGGELEMVLVAYTAP